MAEPPSHPPFLSFLFSFSLQAYLNMDMIGSPNYIRAIYNGKEAENEAIRLGSGNIQKLFESHFEEHELTFTVTEFDGRSDYGPFIENGIPAGGVFVSGFPVFEFLTLSSDLFLLLPLLLAEWS
jgi:Zn-dependent M28 family amino/carboxypeptidase